MCTVVVLRRPEADWPLILAGNRDEMGGRPWLAPGRHWPDRAEVVAGLDQLAGGSWLGLNDHGVMAVVLNRVGTLGPAPGLRSRGELVLEALDHADAVEAASALAHLDGRAWRPFNLLVADNRDAFWLRADGTSRVTVHPVGEGLHMLTALDLDDPASARIRAYAPRFAAAAVPDPSAGNWAEWQALMSCTGIGPDGEEVAAMTFCRDDGFGTVSSSLIALPSAGLEGVRPVWLFAPGRPDRTPFAPVAL